MIRIRRRARSPFDRVRLRSTRRVRSRLPVRAVLPRDRQVCFRPADNPVRHVLVDA